MKIFPILRWKKSSAVIALIPLAVVSASVAQYLPPSSREAILGHLNAAITWYRDATTKIQDTGLPSDAIYEDSAKNNAAEAVRLAFQAARAEAAVIRANDKTPNSSEAPKAPQKQNLSKVAAQIAAQIDDTQTRLDEVNKQLASAPRSKRKGLLEQRERLEGKLSLDKAVQDAVQKMAAFAEDSADSAGEGLEGSINQLARSVPEVVADKALPKSTAKASPSTFAKIRSFVAGTARVSGGSAGGPRPRDHLCSRPAHCG